MAPTNNLMIETYGSQKNIEDHRWRVTRSGMTDGQNGDLVIDDALKADEGQRVEAWILSGTPLYRDEDHNLRFFNAQASTDGKECVGFLMSPVRIMDFNGGFYDQVPVAVQTWGEVHLQWLPTKIAEADIPNRFGVTKS